MWTDFYPTAETALLTTAKESGEGGRDKELAWLLWAIVDASTASLFLDTLLDSQLAFTKGRV